MEALYGYQGAAVARARTVVQSATAFEPQLRAAAALAWAGEPDQAESVIRRLRSVRPADTLLHAAYLPVAEAAVQMGRGRAAAAIEALRPAARYERGMVAALAPAYMRGEARLRAGAPADAVREFRTVLDNRGADLFSPLLPMAQLGLARALGQRGQRLESRQAYDALLAIWTAADRDLPALAAARKEQRELSLSPTSRGE